MVLQAGTTGSLLASNNINVNNVSAAQNLSLFATGDSSGAGTGTAIQVGGTSSVAGTITASGFNAANQFSATNGNIDITLASGNLTTALAWGGNGDNITLTANNGSILQNFAQYGYNGKTIYAANGGDVSLTALGGVGSYISTGVNALGAGSDLLARASGQNAGVSVQLFGRVDGNLTTHHTSGAGTALTGGVNLGTGIGAPLNLNDVYTVEDVMGSTSVRALGAVNLYGSFWGPVSVLNSSSITAVVDKGPLNISTAQSTGAISLTSLMGRITGTNVNSSGGGNIFLQAGSQTPRDKMAYISIANLTTTGNLTADAWGSTTGNSTGSAISITGSVSGSKTTSTHVGGSVSVP